MHLHLLPVSSRGALGVKRGKEGMGCRPSLGSQHEAEEGHPDSAPQHFTHTRSYLHHCQLAL